MKKIIRFISFDKVGLILYTAFFDVLFVYISETVWFNRLSPFYGVMLEPRRLQGAQKI